ncbi:hypothetical protein ACIBHY_17215 [Nonomuraea sp. NPDC050547]|uniref:hypothetical protein n=1 Tax=Nonomuraea sp. NPDC050547 TaxID=3364368 RepID=UPI0037A1003D
MALHFLGKETDGGNSPTLWLDDERDEYVLQGWEVTDSDSLAAIGTVPAGELVLRVPTVLMNHLPKGDG